MNGTMWSSTHFYGSVHHITSMRTEPSISFSLIGDIAVFAGGTNNNPTAFSKTGGTNSYSEINFSGLSNTAGRGAWARIEGGDTNYADFDAEL